MFEELLKEFPVLNSCKESMLQAFFIIVNTYEHNGKLLVCGNGGSASDAEHIVGELMKGFRSKRGIPKEDRDQLLKVDPVNGEGLIRGLQCALPAISLVSQTSLLTAFANDVDADMIFAQQVYGYGEINDVLIAITTSGNSKNVINAAIIAKALGMNIIGLTGKSGGKLLRYCDVAICVPSDITFRIQEYHLPVYHALCAMVEQEFFG